MRYLRVGVTGYFIGGIWASVNCLGMPPVSVWVFLIVLLGLVWAPELLTKKKERDPWDQ